MEQLRAVGRLPMNQRLGVLPYLSRSSQLKTPSPSSNCPPTIYNYHASFLPALHQKEIVPRHRARLPLLRPSKDLHPRDVMLGESKVPRQNCSVAGRILDTYNSFSPITAQVSIAASCKDLGTTLSCQISQRSEKSSCDFSDSGSPSFQVLPPVKAATKSQKSDFSVDSLLKCGSTDLPKCRTIFISDMDGKSDQPPNTKKAFESNLDISQDSTNRNSLISLQDPILATPTQDASTPTGNSTMKLLSRCYKHHFNQPMHPSRFLSCIKKPEQPSAIPPLPAKMSAEKADTPKEVSEKETQHAKALEDQLQAESREEVQGQSDKLQQEETTTPKVESAAGIGESNNSEELERGKRLRPRKYSSSFFLPRERRSRAFLKRRSHVLGRWFVTHFTHPYPNKSQKDQLAKETNMSRNQVSEWFGNMRRRIREVNKNQEGLSWEQQVLKYNSLITDKSDPLPIEPGDYITTWMASNSQENPESSLEGTPLSSKFKRNLLQRFLKDSSYAESFNTNLRDHNEPRCKRFKSDSLSSSTSEENLCFQEAIPPIQKGSHILKSALPEPNNNEIGLSPTKSFLPEPFFSHCPDTRSPTPVTEVPCAARNIFSGFSGHSNCYVISVQSGEKEVAGSHGSKRLSHFVWKPVRGALKPLIKKVYGRKRDQPVSHAKRELNRSSDEMDAAYCLINMQRMDS